MLGKHLRTSKSLGEIKILIASPGDVGELRQEILKTLPVRFDKDLHEQHCGYRIKVFGWEDLASMPGYAQDCINENLLSKMDIILAIFRHKLGTPVKDLTTGINRSESGTAEELWYAIEKPSEERPLGMAYFYDGEPNIDEFDVNYQNVLGEWKRREDFRLKIQTKIVYKTFTDDIDKTIRNLCLDIEKNILSFFVPIHEIVSVGALEKLKELSSTKEQLEEAKRRLVELEVQLASQNNKHVALEQLELGNFGEANRILLNQLETLEGKSSKEYSDSIAQTSFELGKLDCLRLKYDLAKEHFQKAVSLRPDNTLYLNELGLLLVNIGFPKQGLKYLLQSLDILKLKFGENSGHVASAYNNLGGAYSTYGYNDEGLEYFQRALNIDLNNLGETHPAIATRYNNIGATYQKLKRPKEALEYLSKALEIDKCYYGYLHKNTSLRYNNIGYVYYELGRNEKALENFRLALDIESKIYGFKHPNIAVVYNNMGLVYMNKQKYKDALVLFKKTNLLDEEYYGKDNPNTAISYSNLAAAYSKLNDNRKALHFSTKAYEIFLDHLGPLNESTLNARKRIEMLKNGKP